MRRAILACSFLVFCVAAPATASGEDVVRDALGSSAPGPHRVSQAPITPLVPEQAATNWCERPDDPRCSPASPAPSSPMALSASVPAAIPPHAPPRVAPPRLAASPRPLMLPLGPSAGVRNRIERPPA